MCLTSVGARGDISSLSRDFLVVINELLANTDLAR